MKYWFTVMLLALISVPGFTALAPATPLTATAPSAEAFSREAVEFRLGRSLNFKERVALSAVRGKTRRAERRAARAKNDGTVDGFAFAAGAIGILTLTIGLVGVVLFSSLGALIVAALVGLLGLIFGIIGLTRIGRAKQYRRGKAGAILGIVAGGLGLLFIGLVLIAIATSDAS